MPAHLSAAEAAVALGISIESLYAYVSRGLLRSEAVPGSRQRRYLAEDVWLLKERKAHRRDPVQAAAGALHWGLPVLESRLSVIHDGRLYYGGHDAVGLATSCTVEQVAALLWTGDLDAPFPEEVPPVPRGWVELLRIGGRLPPLEALQLVLPVAAAGDATAYDLRPPAVQRTGARILRLLAAVGAGVRPSAAPVVNVLRRRWAPRCPQASRLLQAALVLYADNGLNPSSFTARCAASAGATPYALVAAGLAALQGSKHGGACERAEGLLEAAGEPRAARRVVLDRLRRGEAIPGFGHPLYPDGDPRGALLMDLVATNAAGSHELDLSLAVAAAVYEVTQQRPTVDFGVVALCRALGLPRGAPLTLLGVGRVVGWIGHGLEQYQEGRTIRPRARYAGAPPRR